MKPARARQLMARYEQLKLEFPEDNTTKILEKAGIASSQYYKAKGKLKKNHYKPVVDRTAKTSASKTDEPQMMLLIGSPDQIREFMVNR